MNATELLATWDIKIADLNVKAANRRHNGMRESAALLRTEAATMKTCADALRAVVNATPVIAARPALEACGDIFCTGHPSPILPH